MPHSPDRSHNSPSGSPQRSEGRQMPKAPRGVEPVGISDTSPGERLYPGKNWPFAFLRQESDLQRENMNMTTSITITKNIAIPARMIINFHPVAFGCRGLLVPWTSTGSCSFIVLVSAS